VVATVLHWVILSKNLSDGRSQGLATVDHKKILARRINTTKIAKPTYTVFAERRSFLLDTVTPPHMTSSVFDDYTPRLIFTAGMVSLKVATYLVPYQA
jgi:hypothetical protein